MAMRWLDRDYLDGVLPDVEADARLEAWRDARSTMSRTETGAIAELTDVFYLGDAVVDAFCPTEQGAVQMALIVGDLQRGYERLSLLYAQAAVVEDEGATFAECLRPGAEVVADEMHVLAPERFEHSFILDSRGAFSVQFHRLELTSTAVPADVRNRLIDLEHGN